MAVILETDVNASNDLGRLKIDAAINETTEPCSDQSFAQTTGTNAKDLEALLLHKKELVLDFKSLKSCLDPLNETVVSKDTEKDGEQFDYEGFVYDCFENGDTFPVLESLVIRNLKLSTEEPLFDNSAYLCHGMMQLNTLVELDIGGNQIPEDFQSLLQFWNLYNLKKLIMDSTGLKKFPPSAGRLRKLEVLSLSKNKLEDLPVTLGFCERIKVLNLQGNNFRRIPGIVLHLKNLEELRRLDNPLPPRWQGFASPPHVNVPNQPTSKTNEKNIYNPESLQRLCTKVTFTHQIDYWKHESLGVLQCQTLDSLASHFTVCEQCHTAIPNTGKYTVQVMLVSYLGLRDVPFVLHACSELCQETIKVKLVKRNQELQRNLDEEYEKSIRHAQKLVNENEIDISPETINAPENQVFQFIPDNIYRASDYSQPRRGRRRKKCIVM